MSRIPSLAAWVVGAAASTVAYWYVVVYLFDEFDHGYGRDTWFQFNLYLSMFAVLAGLIGYAVLAVFRRRPRTVAAAYVAGAVFTACELLFVFALGRVFPDRDLVIQGLAGALVIGALSTLVAWPDAA